VVAGADAEEDRLATLLHQLAQERASDILEIEPGVDGASELEQRDAESVALGGGVADDGALLLEGGEDAEDGALADGEGAGEVGDGEARLATGQQPKDGERLADHRRVVCATHGSPW
jgi:hypothetical protein